MRFQRLSSKLSCLLTVLALSGSAASAGEGCAHVRNFARGLCDACHGLSKESCPLRHDIHVIHDYNHGWARPVAIPMRRSAVGFQHYVMPAGTARNSSAPMVYLPTDTTQLGFVYHRVPQWQANPGMIPAAPYPPQWHQRFCQPHAMAGQVIYHHAAPMNQASPTPLPKSEQAVPPAPATLDRSASAVPMVRPRS